MCESKGFFHVIARGGPCGGDLARRGEGGFFWRWIMRFMEIYLEIFWVRGEGVVLTILTPILVNPGIQHYCTTTASLTSPSTPSLCPKTV